MKSMRKDESDLVEQDMASLLCLKVKSLAVPAAAEEAMTLQEQKKEGMCGLEIVPVVPAFSPVVAD